MGVFDGIETAGGGFKGCYFIPRRIKGHDGEVKNVEANYRVRIKEAKQFRTRKTADAVTVLCEILESNVPERPPGTECSYYTDSSKEPFVANVADFLRAALSSLSYADGEPATPAEIDLDEDLADWALGEEGPLVGVELNVRAFNKKTKAGNDFTMVDWQVPPDVVEGAAA